MSDIFNLVILNNNEIEHIYIFTGMGNNDYETNNSEIINYIESNNISFTIIQQEIYNDDSIMKMFSKNN